MTSVHTPPEVPFSDFEKNPSATLSGVDQEPVKVTRDAGQSSLLVTTVDRLDRNVEVLDVLIALLEAFVKHASGDGDAPAAVLPRLLPWVAALPTESQELMTKQIMDAADCEGSEERVNRLDAVLCDWEDTVEALGDREFMDLLRGSVGNHGAVPTS